MDDFEAIELLEERGFTFTRGGEINPPNMQWPYVEKADETEALNELCYEWDYCYPSTDLLRSTKDTI